MSDQLNLDAQRAAPCPLCDSQQVQVCRDSNNQAKDSARCRECKCTAPLSVWNRRTAPSAPMGEELPKWIDDHKGADPFMDDVIAYIESMQSQYAERIRQLERELQTASKEGRKYQRKVDEKIMAHRLQGVALLLKCSKCGADRSKEPCGNPQNCAMQGHAYIDGRTAGSTGDDKRAEREAVSTMLWLYRRLPRCYGRPPNVEKPIVDLAKLANYEMKFVTESFAERTTKEEAND
jgi:hypothetical protein